MKKKIKFCLVILMLASINTFSQTSNSKTNNPLHLTPEQKYKDSVEFAKFKKNNPELFLNKRLPVKLKDSGWIVKGFITSIKIQNNHIKDSVYHNFHPGMPDTSTVNPFNDIKITDAVVQVALFSHAIMGGANDSTAITSVDPDLIINNMISNLPIADFSFSKASVRISLNGKIIFDWKLISNFPKIPFKVFSKFHGFGQVSMVDYVYGYTVCDTTIHINDQLLIEVKNTENNWMIDRYNITRVAMAPEISSVY
ncbi:MAG: hypothetical protein ABIY62_04630, partial [Ginsengibacter sp.]